MKECPECGTKYSDDTQQFCLSDGKELRDVSEVETVESVRIEEKNSSGFLLGVLTSLIGVMLIAGIAFGVSYYLAMNITGDSPISNENSNEESTVGEGFKSEEEETEKKTYVNSPRDGFLALRSSPNHRTGKLLAKIPHGYQLELNSCRSKTKIGKNTGRWCRTSYKGTLGWVFDAWTVRK